MQQAFELLANGKFVEGLSLLNKLDEWRDDDTSLEKGNFYLGFPGARGWGEGLLIASLLKRHAVTSKSPIEVFAPVEVCEILKSDHAFRLHEVSDFDKCRSRGGRSPIAILNAALVNSLLDYPFVEIAASSPCKSHNRVGIAWASIDKAGRHIREKSISLQDFSRILQKLVGGRPGDVVSFQRHISEAECRVFRELYGTSSLICEDLPVDRLAKEVASLRCMFTISTTTAHIAACLGIPTILLAAKRHGQQWFWRVQSEHGKTIYPSVRVVLGGEGKEWWHTIEI